MPLTAAQLEGLVDTASRALQGIQDECGRERRPDARVRFPRGFIRTVPALRATLPRIGTRVQRSNACYLLMKLDVSRWMIVRTDLWGAPLSMIIKDGIFVIGSLCEWMTKEALRGHGAANRFTTKTARLVELEVINEELKQELDWVWGIRCAAHFGEVTSLEHELYTRPSWDRAILAGRALRDRLIAIHGPA